MSALLEQFNNPYLWWKTLHIISSVLLVGTGFGTAFYLFMANRMGNVAAIATVAKLVAKADWWFTTPAVIIQPISGIMMAQIVGWSLFSTPWLVAALILYALAGICWLPVVWLQLKMRDIAVACAANGQELPPLYWRYARYWELLGYPAFTAMVVVFALMVFKPS